MRSSLLCWMVISMLAEAPSLVAAIEQKENGGPISAANPSEAAPSSEAKKRSAHDLGKRIATLVQTPSQVVTEITALVEKGVEDSVVLAYIENSNPVSSPTANDILYLHERSVSSQVITALLRRSAVVRQEYAQARQQNQAQEKGPNGTQRQGQANYGIASVTPSVQTYAYPQPYPVYVPSGYPASSYSYSYSYGYSLPSYSLYSLYAYRPYYYHYSYYPSRYYGACFPRYNYTLGIGAYRHHYPRFGLGSSYGHFGRHGCRIR